MARAFAELFPQFRFDLVRHGVSLNAGDPADRLGFTKVESLPDDRVAVQRMHGTSHPVGTLAKTFGDGGEVSIFMFSGDKASGSPIMQFDISYEGVEWLPFNLDSKSSDVAEDRIELLGVKVLKTGIVTYEEYEAVVSENA